MISAGLQLGLSKEEVAFARASLGREPSETEWAVIDAEWSEHNSYKSSKGLLKLFPTTGKRVVLGPGYDAGVVDVGGGYVATIHIESHNHPSAVDPYGGSSTGIGGVLRDILSMGTRPIALLDILRFGDVERSAHSRWLLRNVVRGIADYGNCVGVPTVAGDIEFDASFEKNCLVDVACVGVGKRDSVILGEATHPGDVIVLAGGSTGRDGVGGATFASQNLVSGRGSDRSAVQVPDPFMKKLLIDSVLEAAATGMIRGMKDLGGGGLSTGLSEMASKGGTGIDVELSRVMMREPDMSPSEIMVSESQERMLLLLDPGRSRPVLDILEKYEVPHNVIGRVTDDGIMRVRWGGKTVVSLPAELVANAPLVNRVARKPSESRGSRARPKTEPAIEDSLMHLVESPGMASRRWVFEQYDYEVGADTVLKPGMADAALLRLPNGGCLAVKADGNSKHSHLDPRRGAAGCVAEACRNVVAVGAEPLAVVDHLQFGDPSDPGVYWAFRESVEGMAEYCRGVGLPVVGGKVSFYKEDADSGLPVKPSPIAMVVGLAPGKRRPLRPSYRSAGEWVFLLGSTKPELGGSEYYESVLGISAGTVPNPDPVSDSRTYDTVRKLLSAGMVSAVHDCSKGGLAVALAELSMSSGRGATFDLGELIGPSLTPTDALFSESHGRFLISTFRKRETAKVLSSSRLPYRILGRTGGESLVVAGGSRIIIDLDVVTMTKKWEGTFPRLLD